MESPFDFASILNEQSRNILRDAGFADALTKFVRATPDVLNFETILLKEPLSLGVHQGKTRARQYHRHTAQQIAIQHFGLSKVGNFGGAADVGDRWQKEILHNGPKQRIRAEAFWFAMNGREQICFGPGFLAGLKFSSVACDCLAAVP